MDAFVAEICIVDAMDFLLNSYTFDVVEQSTGHRS